MNLVFLFLAAVLRTINALGPRAAAPLSSVNQSTWEAFSGRIGGRLYDGEPMLAPCYIRYNGHLQRPDAGECTALQRNRNNANFTSDHFGGYRNVNWGACQATGAGCAFGTRNPDLITPVSQPCFQGSVPSKYVDARSVEDIQKTLAFARINNLRLVIKNTGHDYTGRSSGPDSLGLWTHHIQPPIRLEQDFIPEGCSEVAGDGITFGAGQQFAGIYEFAREHDYRVVGGSSSTVGAAGGWITGGGHSLLSNELGLGVDNVLQLRAILPNSTYITANRCQNQDIFFALRGGGGGTFAVITEMSVLAHPEKPMVAATATFMSLSPTSAAEFISIIVANADRWAAEGWGGYIQPGVLGNGVSSFIMATSMLNQSAAETSMRPVMDFAHRLGTLSIANISSTNTYSEVLESLIGDGASQSLGGGGGMAMSSRIIPREYFQGLANQKKLSSILNDVLVNTQNDSHDLHLVAPMAPLFICVTAPTTYSQSLPKSEQAGGPGASSVTPAWRAGLWHAIHLRPFSGSTISDPDAVRDIFQAAHDTMEPLRRFAPDGGAYLNEADAFETDPVGAFWGEENYARLLRIKEEIDPTNLLSVHQGVGWDSEDKRFDCYPDVDITA
ncbi:hypothetical protein BDW62DRAFT_196904 [Aspergillus aurantiobrunneus]